MAGILKLKSYPALCRRLSILLLPSLLLLLYLTSTDRLASDSQTLRYEAGDTPPIPILRKLPGATIAYNFSAADLNKHVKFSTAGDGDVMVFLHMQKTGGTFFGKNLVRNLKLDTPCHCTKGDGMLRCPCMSRDQKRYWLFSRYSTGWKCGLHADYTELSECLNSGRLDKLEEGVRTRRYHYVSVLRDPSQRYVSEWMHVSRGASWIGSSFRCNGRTPSARDLPPCHIGDSWLNVTLNEFLDCPHNLARNRQTRMLANLSEIGCYSTDMMDNETKRRRLLESAKKTLRGLTYFSIMPYINESQFLFENTFDLEFQVPMYRQRNRHNRYSSEVLQTLPTESRQRILEVNDLDVELFKYAKELFLQRYRTAVRQYARTTYTPPY